MSECVTVCSGWECIVRGVGFRPDLTFFFTLSIVIPIIDCVLTISLVHSVRLDSVMQYKPCTCSTLLQVFSTQKAAFIFSTKYNR